MASVWLSYFCGKSHFEDDGTQNYLVFQPIYKCFKTVANTNNPANIRLDEDVWKTSWRRLEDVFHRFFSSEDVFKKLSRGLDQEEYIRHFLHVFRRHLQDVLFHANILKKSLKDFKDVFKTSSRRFQAYQQIKLFWLSCF